MSEERPRPGWQEWCLAVLVNALQLVGIVVGTGVVVLLAGIVWDTLKSHL